MNHLSPEEYVQALRGELPVEWLYHRALGHLREVCGKCSRLAGNRLSIRFPGVDESSAAEPEETHLPLLPDDPRALSLQDLVPHEKLLSLIREAARVAGEDLAELLQLPQSEWHDRVVHARSRFQDRAFAEALIEEARQRVWTAPAEAAALAELVGPALDREGGRLRLPWARCLIARARAHHANALRVGGDLVAAAEEFAVLHNQLTRAPLGEPAILAEIQSLEASLRIDQRQLGRGEELLRAAISAYRQAGDACGEGRTLIQLANLNRTAGRPEEVVPLLTRAQGLIDAAEEPSLHFGIVQGLINVALEFGDADRAARLLEAERSAYLDKGDDYTAAVYGFLWARVEFGRGCYDQAVEGFEEALQELLSLGRTYDSILAGLYKADALLAGGRMAELYKLAESLVPLFRSRGVDRETLASLRLLVEAAREEAVTAAVIEEVRQLVSRVAGRSRLE